MDDSNSDVDHRSLQLARRMQTVSSLSLDTSVVNEEVAIDDEAIEKKNVVTLTSLGVLNQSDSYYDSQSEQEEAHHVADKEEPSSSTIALDSSNHSAPFDSAGASGPPLNRDVAAAASPILKCDTRYSSPSRKSSTVLRTFGVSGNRFSLKRPSVPEDSELSEADGLDHSTNSSAGAFMNRVQMINPLKAVGHILKDQVGSPVAASWHRASSHFSSEGDDSGSNRDGKVPDEVGARLKLLLSASMARKSIPKEVKAMRDARLTGMDTDVGQTSPPTKLHFLCAQESVSLLHLQTELASSPSSASLPDAQGRLPLHILGDNVDLISTKYGKSTASKFALHLMKVYPEAITTPDALGFYPFVSLVHDWEKWTYQSFDCKRAPSKMFVPASRLFGRVADAVTNAGVEFSHAMERSFHGSLPTNTEISSSLSKAVSTHLFPRVTLWEDVEWCLEMLSVAMDELGGRNGGLHDSENDASGEFNERDYEARNLLAKHLPLVVPSIIKTLLLIEGGEVEGTARKRIVQSSIFRAMLLRPESVGDWLTSMIRKRGLPSKRAIDYLTLVSSTSVEDYVGGFRTSLPVDKEAFHEARTEVFNAIDELDGAIASLVILGEREVERAVSTSVIWCKFMVHLPSQNKIPMLSNMYRSFITVMMSKNLARPFVVSVSLIDFVLQIVLLLAFRNDASATFAQISGPRIPTNIVYLICINYFIRKGCESLALFNLSGAVFRNHLLNLWNVFDMLAIIMVLAAYRYDAMEMEGTELCALQDF